MSVKLLNEVTVGNSSRASSDRLELRCAGQRMNRVFDLKGAVVPGADRRPNIFTPTYSNLLLPCFKVGNPQRVRLAGGWWLVLICSERKVLLAGCWWLVCSERKILLAGG
jgi:hypothetical protein